MNCGKKLPDGAKFCYVCGSKLNAKLGAKMHDVVATRSDVSQSAEGGATHMHDVVAQKSKISQSSTGKGEGKMENIRAEGSQFGQASVGSIHIGDRKRACSVCGNYISSENRSVVCLQCGAKFCETCESYFRSERKRGEQPLCQACFTKNKQLIEQERLRRQLEEDSRQPKTGQLWTSPSGIEFVQIPAGSFIMGSAEFDDATPHQVTISKPFCLGKYSITQREWMLVMGTNPSKFKGDSRPVEQVFWNDCQEFIRKLNAREGVNKYRLPTEAEWEYACRAGSKTKFCFGDGDHILSQYAWFDENSGGETHPVGQLNPNDWGLYDMHGNVWEWCYDWYENYQVRSLTDPSGSSSGSYRVYRGGSLDSLAKSCTSAFRYCGDPIIRDYDLGFRLASSSFCPKRTVHG